MESSDDPFDQISTLNSKAYDEGFAEGEISGKKDAYKKGFKVGQETSFNLANELGQYYGQCELYEISHRNDEEPNTKKYTKIAAQVCELIDKFDLLDCHNDNFTSNLNHIRDKYKQFCSLTTSRSYFYKQTLTNVKLSF